MAKNEERYRTVCRACFEKLKKSLERYNSPRHFVNTSNNSGRPQSAAFDEELGIKLDANKDSLIKDLNSAIIQAGVRKIRVIDIDIPAALERDNRKYFDILIKLEGFDDPRLSIIPINIKYVKNEVDCKNNVGGGVAYMDKCLNNSTDNKTLINVLNCYKKNRQKSTLSGTNYFILEFIKSDKSNKIWDKVHFSSIYDGGTIVNGCQSACPGLQFSRKNNTWAKKEDSDSNIKQMEKWISTWIHYRSNKYKKYISW